MSVPTFPTIPHLGSALTAAGVSTDFGTLLPPAGKIACYVRSTGAQSGEEEQLSSRILTTLSAALLEARDSLGDTIVVLPGHTENVTDATMLDNIAPGTRILGVGHGAHQPVFRWTNTAGSWTLDQADCIFSNLYLRLEGADGIVKALDVTGADNALIGCRMQWASGASNKATIACEVGAAAHRFKMLGCEVYGTATHNVTNGVLIDGAADAVKILGCIMTASATAANGLIHVSAAATNLVFGDLILHNSMTSSTSTICFDDVACTGMCVRVASATENDGTASAQGITFGTAATIKCIECYDVDESQKSGILNPAAAT